MPWGQFFTIIAQFLIAWLVLILGGGDRRWHRQDGAEEVIWTVVQTWFRVAWDHWPFIMYGSVLALLTHAVVSEWRPSDR